jgi:hypothetical protein
MPQDYKPDFRALCDELLEALYYETGATTGDWTMLRAKAESALAQSELQGPTDQEITEWADAAPGVPQEALDPEFCGWRRCFGEKEFADTIRAALAHWA